MLVRYCGKAVFHIATKVIPQFENIPKRNLCEIANFIPYKLMFMGKTRKNALTYEKGRYTYLPCASESDYLGFFGEGREYSFCILEIKNFSIVVVFVVHPS